MAMIRHDIPRLPAFRGEAWPWIGGDLQTLKSTFLKDAPTLDAQSLDQSGEVLTLPLDDGDALTAMLHAPPNPKGAIIIVHGLTGCMDSPHVVQMAAAAWRHDRAVLRVNMRGAGPSAALSKKRYSAQSGADLLPFVAEMAARFPDVPLVMVAHSIGGAAALNMLVDHGGQLAGLDGLVTVAAPLDLHDASRRFHQFRNRPYVIYMLRRLKQMALAMEDLTDAVKAQIKTCKTIRQFDDLMTAPMMGFAEAEAYYTAASTHLKLDVPAIPLLMIHADNDPLVGDTALRQLPPDPEKNRHVLISRGGGHVGFHDDHGLWLPRVVLAWQEMIIPPKI